MHPGESLLEHLKVWSVDHDILSPPFYVSVVPSWTRPTRPLVEDQWRTTWVMCTPPYMAHVLHVTPGHPSGARMAEDNGDPMGA